MTRLVRAELARVRARPVVWGTTLAVALATVGLVLVVWWTTRPPTSAELEAAHRSWEDALVTWEQTGDEQVARCRVMEAEVRVAHPDDPDPDLGCDALAPTLERFLPYRPGPVDLIVERVPVAGLTAFLAAVGLGAALVASEFRSGAMSTWLTFEPRRGRVVLGKVAAGAAATLPLVGASVVVLVVGLLVVPRVNGAAADVPSSVVADLVDQAARWTLACLAGSVVGTALAFAVRHAAAVAGVVVWWVVAVESTLRLVLPSAGWVPLATNLRAWTAGEAWYDVPVCAPGAPAAGGGCEVVTHVVGAGQGAATVVAVVGLCLVAGWSSFRRRDVV